MELAFSPDKGPVWSTIFSHHDLDRSFCEGRRSRFVQVDGLMSDIKKKQDCVTGQVDSSIIRCLRRDADIFVASRALRQQESTSDSSVPRVTQSA